jgi:alkylhydroperoxidase/carboxymuconolactone decarboxylase family protein YurZ
MSCFSLELKAQTSEQNQRLSEKQQTLIPIAAYTAIGDLQNLKPALHNGLDAGLTINEIKESMVHLYAYAGFPRSIRGLNTFMDVLQEREADGIQDEEGPEASPINDNRDKYERGVETLYELTGSDWGNPESGYGAFAPAIDRFLKEHLFADLFERDVISYAQRELVVISILSSLDGLEPMLGSHYNLSLNVGFTPAQLNEFVDVIETTLGEEKGEVAQSVLENVLENRDSE